MNITLEEPHVLPVAKLTKDLRKAAAIMDTRTAGYIVGTYYQHQEWRIAKAAQIREASKTGEPHDCIRFLLDQSKTMERETAKILGYWVKNQPLAAWPLSICGIGKIIAAGYLSYIDIRKCPSAANLWSFAGLAPNQKLVKGQRRTWCAEVKRLTWLTSASFVKVSGKQEQGKRRSFYGLLWRMRYLWQQAENERGTYKDFAATTLAAKSWRDGTVSKGAYEDGRLPQGHLLAQSRRWVAKMFLSHLHESMWVVTFPDSPVPMPYILSQPGHTHRITLDMVREWESGEMTRDELYTLLSPSLARHLDAALRGDKVLDEAVAEVDTQEDE